MNNICRDSKEWDSRLGPAVPREGLIEALEGLEAPLDELGAPLAGFLAPLDELASSFGRNLNTVCRDSKYGMSDWIGAAEPREGLPEALRGPTAPRDELLAPLEGPEMPPTIWIMFAGAVKYGMPGWIGPARPLKEALKIFEEPLEGLVESLAEFLVPFGNQLSPV